MIEQIKRIALSALGGAYVLSPVDLIPDIIPVLGQMDDLAVILLMIYLWVSWMRTDQSAPSGQAGTAPGPKPQGDGPVIDIKPVE